MPTKQKNQLKEIEEEVKTAIAGYTRVKGLMLRWLCAGVTVAVVESIFPRNPFNPLFLLGVAFGFVVILDCFDKINKLKIKLLSIENYLDSYGE